MSMTETSREVIKKPRKVWMRYLMLAAGLALGLLLIAFGSVRSGREDKNTESDSELMREYAAAVEEKATRLCESAAGVVRGSVTVTVTLECGYETVYAEDGEKKTASSGTSVSGKYATVGSGSSEQPIKTVTRAPVIAGIGVVCRGGGNELTRAELTALLSAAFGVGTNKIYISESN